MIALRAIYLKLYFTLDIFYNLMFILLVCIHFYSLVSIISRSIFFYRMCLFQSNNLITFIIFNTNFPSLKMRGAYIFENCDNKNSL